MSCCLKSCLRFCCSGCNARTGDCSFHPCCDHFCFHGYRGDYDGNGCDAGNVKTSSDVGSDERKKQSSVGIDHLRLPRYDWLKSFVHNDYVTDSDYDVVDLRPLRNRPLRDDHPHRRFLKRRSRFLRFATLEHCGGLRTGGKLEGL